MAKVKVGNTGMPIMRKNIWISESTWDLLKHRASLNGLSPSEEITEMILDADYECKVN